MVKYLPFWLDKQLDDWILDPPVEHTFCHSLPQLFPKSMLWDFFHQQPEKCNGDRWHQIREVELKLHQPSETYLPNLNSCLWFFVFCFLFRDLVFNLLSTNNENTIRFSMRVQIWFSFSSRTKTIQKRQLQHEYQYLTSFIWLFSQWLCRFYMDNFRLVLLIFNIWKFWYHIARIHNWYCPLKRGNKRRLSSVQVTETFIFFYTYHIPRTPTRTNITF